VKALLDANFNVTILTRSKKPGTDDGGAKVVEVDFASVSSLTAALEGIDGLVSAVTTMAVPSQTIMIEAAVAAGVKRFIPSEFGSCTTSPKVKDLPMYSQMFKIKQVLQEKAQDGKLTWTVVACGGFTEFVFGGPVLADFPNRKMTVLDDGNNRFSSTSMESIGKAIAGVFQHPDATQNKIVHVSEMILTQNQLLKIAQELEPGAEWQMDHAQTSKLLAEGLDQLKTSGFSMGAFMKILAGTAAAGDAYGSAYDETDNELFGIKTVGEEDLKKLVSAALVQKATFGHG
jgi:hypothetical protein